VTSKPVLSKTNWATKTIALMMIKLSTTGVEDWEGR
jgi:hypothetical protein